MEIVKIPLRNKENSIIEYALVSPADKEAVEKLRWHVSSKKNRKGKYAYTTVQRREISMHAFLLGKGKIGQVIDHKNRNGLDNTRSNLRFVTVGQNNQNQDLRGGTSKYRGVSWSVVSSKWQAKCGRKHIGLFENEEDCARAYDQAALRIFGSDAQTNFHDNQTSFVATKPVSAVQQALPHGVRKKAHEKNYQASVTWQKQRYYLGRFATVELAQFAVESKKTELANAERESQDKLVIVRNENHVAILPIKDSNGIFIRDILVSDIDWHVLSRIGWSDSEGYAVGLVDGKMTSMHRHLMTEKLESDSKKIIDHINGNKCDNRRENLRLLSYSGNSQNRAKKPGCASEYIGVTKKRKRWAACITKDHKRFNIGYYDLEIEAAISYNKEALRLYDNPRLNLFAGVACISMEEARDALQASNDTSRESH